MSAVAAALATVELLRFEPESQRAKAWWAPLASAAVKEGIKLTTRHRFHGNSDVLLLWGPGGRDRFEAMQRQLAAGGHVVVLDLAYWQRETKARVSIDSAHPQDWVMRRDWPRTRLIADGLTVSNRWNPAGPVIVAGLGEKARAQYGAAAVDAWEAAVARQCRERWPARPVLYRRKTLAGCVPSWASEPTSHGPIEQVLAGSSLVVTWHSNVAVDAIRLGIPVVCRDGAAAAVCPSTIGVAPAPLAPDICDRFLANLAWFQWAPAEARGLWQFLAELLS